MRRIALLIILIMLGIANIRCDKAVHPEPQSSPPPRIPADLTTTEKQLINSSNLFGLKLFKGVNAQEDPNSNIFFSPLSVSYALGMLYNGAGGDTRAEIAATLEMSDLTPEQINQSYRDLTDLLINLDQSVIFNIANSIWYRNGLPVIQSFSDLIHTYFDARITGLDFADPAAVEIINGWVNENTNGKIEKVINGDIPADVVMYLINAIYFKGEWRGPFDPEETRPCPFHLVDGSEIECQMMFKDTSQFYFQNELVQAVDLPYGHYGFRMAVILPRPSVSVDFLVEHLTSETWAQWTDAFLERRVWLGLPKFRFKYDVSLSVILQSMGMESAFCPGADFSSMVAGGGVWVDKVTHSAFVQVDEKGTEAAAATVVVVVTSIPPTLIADRPFLIVIHERESGSILFMGKVVNPEWVE